jgi:hypothetical protein
MKNDLNKIIDICENVGWGAKEVGSSLMVSYECDAGRELSEFGLRDGLDYTTFVSSDISLAQFAEKMEEIYIGAREGSENWAGQHGDASRKMFDELVDKMGDLSNALNDELSRTKGKKKDRDLER